jgi:hypothetical protein
MSLLEGLFAKARPQSQADRRKLDCLMTTAASAIQAGASPGWGSDKLLPTKSYMMCLCMYDLAHSEQAVGVMSSVSGGPAYSTVLKHLKNNLHDVETAIEEGRYVADTDSVVVASADNVAGQDQKTTTSDMSGKGTAPTVCSILLECFRSVPPLLSGWQRDWRSCPSVWKTPGDIMDVEKGSGQLFGSYTRRCIHPTSEDNELMLGARTARAAVVRSHPESLKLLEHHKARADEWKETKAAASKFKYKCRACSAEYSACEHASSCTAPRQGGGKCGATIMKVRRL